MSLYTRIIEKRKKLDSSILKNGLNSEATKKISLEIDNLINQYYKKEKQYKSDNMMIYFYKTSIEQLQNLYFQERIFPTVESWNRFAKKHDLLSSESLKYISGLNWNRLRDKIYLNI